MGAPYHRPVKTGGLNVLGTVLPVRWAAGRRSRDLPVFNHFSNHLRCAPQGVRGANLLAFGTMGNEMQMTHTGADSAAVRIDFLPMDELRPDPAIREYSPTGSLHSHIARVQLLQIRI